METKRGRKKSIHEINAQEQIKQDAKLGKMPPQAIDVEDVVLGSFMIDKEALMVGIDLVDEKHFYREQNQIIHRNIKEIFNHGDPVDILTVTQQLRKNKELDLVGGAYYISQLTERVGSTANIEYHCRMVMQKYMLRELINISNITIQKAYDPSTDIFDLIDESETKIFEIADDSLKKGVATLNNLLTEAIKRIETNKNNDSDVIGVPSGFKALDAITAGFQPGTMNIIAARPAMGKTAFVLSLARNAAVDYKQPIAFFSLEMSAIELVNRLISSEAEIDGMKIKKGNLQEYEWTQLTSRITRLSDAPLLIDDSPGLNLFQMRAKARRLKQKHNIQMIIIDYLQLMSGGGDGDQKSTNREQEISMISRGLKKLSKELHIPIIALSQLSRQAENRSTTKIPQLSDLRESGAIEQDADMVMFIYRPEYYGITEDEDQTPTKGLANIIIAKHRSGETGTIKLRFVNNFAKFTNWEDSSSFNTESTSTQSDWGTVTRVSKMNDKDSQGDSHSFSDEPSPF